MDNQLPWWMQGDEPDTRIRADIRPTILDNTVSCDSCGGAFPSFAMKKQQEFNICDSCCG